MICVIQGCSRGRKSESKTEFAVRKEDFGGGMSRAEQIGTL
jgi:hypothetical protein